MLVSVVGDESSDETQERVFAIAVLFAPEDAWGPVERQWVARTGGKVFHAAECETEFALDPDRRKHADNLALYRDLVSILASSQIGGCGVAVDLARYREWRPTHPRGGAYLFCLDEAIDVVLRHTAYFNKIRPDGRVTSLKFTLDRRRESQHNAGLLYDLFIRSPHWRRTGNEFLERTLSFASREDPRVQMADLLARETMKTLDNRVGPVKRPERKSMKALLSNRAMKFLIFNGGVIDALQRLMTTPEVMSHPKTAEIARYAAEYRAWLLDSGLVDNWSNRLRFSAILCERKADES